MRIGRWAIASLITGLAAYPAQARAQTSVKVEFGAKLGPAISVVSYDPARMGEWHANYTKWSPATLYDVNGHYYRYQVQGARPVVAYSYKGEYFFPPQDKAWISADKRVDYKLVPGDPDYARVTAYTAAPVVSAQLGEEIGVVPFSAERAGDWHANYTHWTPVSVYEVNGKFYPNHAAGARTVEIYRYKDEYFLPPQDKAWIGVDKRYDYAHRPMDPH
jgi:hypothetical protein